MLTLSDIIAPIIVFGLIVLIHEGGHFVTAKLTGMKVEEFAVGFGPKIWSKQIGETIYSLRAFPLGGFNKIMGMMPGESTDPRAFTERPIWARLIVISAGSFMNIFSAFLIFVGIFLAIGVQSFPNRPEVGGVMSNSPAASVGIQPGDTIVSIEGQPVEKWTDMAALLGKEAKRIVPLEIRRDGEVRKISVIPEESEDGRAVIGITPALESHPVTIGEALYLGADRSVLVVKMVFQGLAAALTGESKDVSGPIGIARMAGNVADAGMLQFFLFIAIISLNLGIMNLFPIPLLDGGLFFLTLGEAIFRRKLSGQVLYYIQTVGITILVAMFLYGTMNDISSLMK